MAGRITKVERKKTPRGFELNLYSQTRRGTTILVGTVADAFDEQGKIKDQATIVGALGRLQAPA